MNVDITKVEKLYSDNIDKFGITSKSVGWPDEKAQSLRFKKLLAVIENKDDLISVNDLGCGYGEQFKYMVENGYNLKHFWGCDISQKMIDAAKKYITSKNTEFVLSDKLSDKADYSFTSGIFNVKFEESIVNWEKYIEQTLIHLNEFSIKGFAFNLLTSYVDYKEDHLYYGDSMKYFDFCKRNFSKKVALFHDYDLWEWTLVVKK